MIFFTDDAHKDIRDNGSIGFRAHGIMGTLSKVKNCPIKGTELRLTARCTNYADTWFSVPAEITYKKKHITGFVSSDESGYYFVPYDYGRNAALLK